MAYVFFRRLRAFRRVVIGGVLAAVTMVVAGTINPVRADEYHDWRWREHLRHEHEWRVHHRGYWDHGYWDREPEYYRPPPVYYAPPPPPPGVDFVFRFGR